MLFDILNLIGVIACACTGALQAGRQKMDYFGVLIIAAVTALGGGSIRDVLLGHYPLSWVAEPYLLYVVIVSAAVTIIIAPFFHYLKTVFLVLDAIGMVAFALLGALVAVNMHMGFEVTCIAGVATGAFGGVLRDLLCNRLPLAFKHELYASIALFTTILFILLKEVFSTDTAMIISAVIGFISRIYAIRYSLSLPIFDYDDNKYVHTDWMDAIPHRRLANKIKHLKESLIAKQKEVEEKRIQAHIMKRKLLREAIQKSKTLRKDDTKKPSSLEKENLNLSQTAVLMTEKTSSQASTHDFSINKVDNVDINTVHEKANSELVARELEINPGEDIIKELAKEGVLFPQEDKEASTPQENTTLVEDYHEEVAELISANDDLQSMHEELEQTLASLKECGEEGEELYQDFSTSLEEELNSSQELSEQIENEVKNFKEEVVDNPSTSTNSANKD